MDTYRLGRGLLLAWFVAANSNALAADSPWSAVRQLGNDAENHPPFLKAGSDSERTVFDITVSLYSNPVGDDKYPESAGADGDQQRYEQIFEHFADALCEQTNGAHHLGQVKIFRKGRQASTSDVVWLERCHPSASPAGLGFPGKRINMCDRFETVDYLARPQEGGYTLGHEWGHYGLGLYDEYRGGTNPPNLGVFAYLPRTTDNATSPSIMSNQWNAAGGQFQWLNHSTANNIGTPGRTAQGRVYGKSGWDALLQSTSEDPRDPFSRFGTSRTRYTNLTPPGPGENFVKLDLPGAQASCRTDLDVVWLSENIETQLIIDRSGSMAGSPLANAKTAASTLIDAVTGDATALGVVSFASAVTQDAAIIGIPDPGASERNALKAVVGQMVASGSTALYDGLKAGLDGLASYASANATNAGQVVFVLSDGGDNASAETQETVTEAYRLAQVPIIAFGYGSGAPGTVLAELAADTGGRFYSSPTSLAEIQSAFLDANAAVTDLAVPSSGVSSVAPGTMQSVDFEVDSTLASLNVSVAFRAASDVVPLQLLGPSGTAAGGSFACSQPSADSTCVLALDQAALAAVGPGSYRIRIGNNGAAPLAVRHFVSATPKSGATYDARLASLSGQSLRYPAPMVLGISVQKEWPITGLSVRGEVTDPTGVITPLLFKDDGAGGDELAGDGLYSAVFAYAHAGLHQVSAQVDNAAGTGAYTEVGFLKSVLPDGSDPGPQSLSPLGENFSRSTTLQVNVLDLLADDHANLPAGTCTAKLADNSDTQGRIDVAGDIDCFSIGHAAAASAINVRVSSLAPDMRPHVEVYGGNGTALIAEGDFDANFVSVGGVVIAVPAAAREPAGVVVMVRDMDSTAATGSYLISAGPPLVSDAEPVLVDLTPDPFSFTTLTGAPFAQLQLSEHITVGGIDEPVAITVSGGEYSLNDAAFTTLAGAVMTGDRVQLRHLSSSELSTAVTTTLAIGGVSGSFSSVTRDSYDTTPDAFHFIALTEAAFDTLQVSDSVGIGGIEVPTGISVVGGEYSINGAAFTASASTISAGDAVRVRHRSSSALSTTVTTVLNVGGVTAGFSSTTKDSYDTTPDRFSFDDVRGAALGKNQVSAGVAITGIDAPVQISVVGGEYSINDGAFTSAPGMVAAGDSVRVSHVSSSEFSATVQTTLTVGGVADTFSSTTGPGPNGGGSTAAVLSLILLLSAQLRRRLASI